MPGRSRGAWSVFVLVEVCCLVAVPALVYIGLNLVLESRSGTFEDPLTPGAAGYRALVDPSPVIALVEVANERVDAVTVLVSAGTTEAGGAAIFVPGEVVVEGRRLDERQPVDVVAAVEATLDLRIPETIVADADAWQAALGTRAISFSNPDPVAGPDGETRFPVGSLDLLPAEIPDYLSGRGESAVLGEEPAMSSAWYRHQLFWRALLEDPVPAQGDLGSWLADVGGGVHVVERLPVEVDDNGVVLPAEEKIDALIRRTVPFPEGAAPGGRIQASILGPGPIEEAYDAATELGSLGFEVVSVGTTGDNDPYQLASNGNDGGLGREPDQLAAVDTVPGFVAVVAPGSLPSEQWAALVELFGSDRVERNEQDDGEVVTFLLGVS